MRFTTSQTMKMTIRSLAASLLIVASGLAFTGCAGTATSKSTGEFIDDAAITTKVKTTFAQDPIVKALDVKVDTFKGTVQLNGFVNTAEEKARAEQLARNIEGVTNVQNNVTLRTAVTR
jgi:hyperosmotically inducible periplasmic protein